MVSKMKAQSADMRSQSYNADTTSKDAMEETFFSFLPPACKRRSYQSIRPHFLLCERDEGLLTAGKSMERSSLPHRQCHPFLCLITKNPFFNKRRGSRVIFPNGAIDPWHALGVLETPMRGLPAIYVEGESHYTWKMFLPKVPANYLVHAVCLFTLAADSPR